jgi:putative hydrolase of the HAD superfamily
MAKIKVLFSDLGGVLLSNGWDRHCRARAAEHFKLDAKEFDNRHQLLFEEYETGRITLDAYLQYTVFYIPRVFSREEFVQFMYAQSQPFTDMLSLIKKLKQEHGLQVVVISNEGKDLTDHRIDSFALKDFVDFFLVSCFLGIRKPNKRVWEMALDFAQVKPEEAIYIDDRKLLAEIAHDMGFHAVHHTDLASTEKALTSLLGQ